MNTVKSKDEAAITACYELAADLISCNVEGVTVTAADLRKKYRVAFDALFKFFVVYFEFIKAIENEKN